MTNLHIRRLQQTELAIPLAWAASEGWNPGLHDATCFYAADPQGFLVGEIEQEAVVTLSAVRYSDQFSFIGLYIVKPEYRHHTNYAMKIGRVGLDYLAGTTMGLDGVVAQESHYAHLFGFQLSHHNLRYRIQGLEQTQAHMMSYVVPLIDLPFSLIENYDRQCFPASRNAFLRAWISQEQTVAYGVVCDGVLQGFGVRRACVEGYKIGPLFADTLAVAETLLQALCHNVPPTQAIYWDIPENNREAMRLADHLALPKMFETVRMYRGAQPQIAQHKVFGVTSFELG